MVVEAHLTEYIDSDNHVRIENEDLSYKNLINQILLSYTHDKEADYHEFGDLDPTDDLKNMYVNAANASFENDNISRFIIEYIPAQEEKLIDFGSFTPVGYVEEFYKIHASSYANLKFIYKNGELPYLKPDVAYDIYRYLTKADGYTRDRYDDFVNFYSTMLNDAEDIIFKSESYQSTHYQTFLSSRKTITQLLNVVLIVSIALAYYLIVFLPMMIFRDGRSFGKIFLRLGTINTDKSEVEVWKYILRSFLGAVSSIYLAFFLTLLPPFNGSSMILYLPFITIGTFDITMINIIIIIFALTAVNGIVMLLTHEKRSITDIIFKTITVDITLLDEPDYDEKEETNA